MVDGNSSFKIGIDFESVLSAISKQIYDTPLAFIRENVQNAIDAIRIQAIRDNKDSCDSGYRVDIVINEKEYECKIQDNGNGMTKKDLQDFYWTIGASGKRSQEAKTAGCVGMFGIGGFANLGVCNKLTVISQVENTNTGTLTNLSEEDIQSASGSIPSVFTKDNNDASPRGTIVIGHLRQPPNTEMLRRYIIEFVKYTEENVYFNGQLISKVKFIDTDESVNLNQIMEEGVLCNKDGMIIHGRLTEDQGNTLVAIISKLLLNGENIPIKGRLRFENGPIDVFKRGFKICATKIESHIGISGRIDCDKLSPTAGRDSLNDESAKLLGKIALLLEEVAIINVLRASERIAQHTRIFQYILSKGWIDNLDEVIVRLADSAETSLGSLKNKAKAGIGIFYGKSQKQALNQIMQARGNMVVILPADRWKQKAVQRYLEINCNAKQFEGIVECIDIYSDLSRFELFFMSEVETNIIETYDIPHVRIIPGKLTEDIPVFIREDQSKGELVLNLDVRHPEITKLEVLGFSQIMYSMVAVFCREYLGSTLRKQSPKFFGNGAINLEWLAKNRSELWVLLKDDIQILSKNGKKSIVRSQKQVVKSSDVKTVMANSQSEPADQQNPKEKPKLLHIIGSDEFAAIRGYYIRLPENPVKVYGDLIKECDSRGVVWAGNKILFVASDTTSSAFHFEIRVEHLIVIRNDAGCESVEGAAELLQPIQELHGGLYFPIPTALEDVLVPKGEKEIRIEVRSDILDMTTSKT
jgi:hypothetical protein